MKFRFTADQFYFLTDIQDSPETKPQRDILSKLQAQAIAAEANALLETEEAKCKRVYGYGLGKRLWSTVPKSGGPEKTHTALLWGVEKIEGEK